MRFGLFLLASAAVVLPQAPTVAHRWITRGPGGPVTALVADPHRPETVFAGVGDLISDYPPSAAFEETDAEGWRKIGTAPPGFVVTAIAVDPQDSNRLFAAAVGSGAADSLGTRLYRSTDGGVSWLQMPEIDGSGLLTTLAVDPSDSRSVYGGGFQPVPPPPGCPGLGTFFCSPMTHGLLFRSIDGGAAWWSRPVVVFVPAISNWVRPESVEEVLISAPGSDILYARADFLLLKTTDRGIDWSSLDVGECDVEAVALIAPSNGNDLFVADTCTFLTSHDAGETFTPISPNAFPGGVHRTEAVAADPRNPDVLYAGYVTSGGQHFIAATRDGGASWTSLGWPSTVAVQRLVVDASGTVLYAATSAGVYECAAPARAPITVPFR